MILFLAVFLISLSPPPELRPDYWNSPASGNFAVDLYGPVDTRPTTWGHADSAVVAIHFHPPTGYRVRVLALRGDLTAWIKTLDGDPATRAESGAGVLAGFQTTSGLNGDSEPSCDLCQSGTPLYIQDWVTDRQPGARAAFSYTGIDTLLDADNTLQAKVAEWLNTTGKPIHLELTYTIQYRFSKY
jgi:hypothetical protein